VSELAVQIHHYVGIFENLYRFSRASLYEKRVHNNASCLIALILVEVLFIYKNYMAWCYSPFSWISDWSGHFELSIALSGASTGINSR